MNKNNINAEEIEIKALREYLLKKFKSSFFCGLSLEKDYYYISDIYTKYPENPSALIAKGYLKWRFGSKKEAELLFERAYSIAKDINYTLAWFEIGVNSFLGLSYDKKITVKPSPAALDFQHIYTATHIKQPIILAACDDIYFQKYGLFFMDICLKHSKGSVHIHVINPSKKTMNFFEKRKGARLSFSIEQSENKHPAYYASSRFLIAPRILDIYNVDILVVDIDTAISRNIDDIIIRHSNNCKDIALPTLKNSWMPWNYYLAGNIYLKNNDRVKNFLSYFANYNEQAIKRLGSYENAWFIDQNALFKSVSFLEKIGGTISDIQDYGRTGLGPSSQGGKEGFAKLLRTYNNNINFSGKSKLSDEDEFLSILKLFLKNQEFAQMYFDSFYKPTK